MKKIVILGNSIAGVRAAEAVRGKKPDWDIKILSFEKYAPYHKEKFLAFLAGEVPLEDLFYRPADFYAANNIQLIHTEGINRINLNRKTVSTAEKEQLSFDVLIISDLPGNKFLPVKGTGKRGVFNVKRLDDIVGIINMLPVIDSAAVRSDTVDGFRLAEALLKMGKEVILVNSQNHLGEMSDKPEDQQWLEQIINHGRLTYVPENIVNEILGEGDVLAVRLESKKVVASQMVLFTEYPVDCRLLADSPLEFDEKIKVDGNFSTNVGDVFAVDYLIDSGVSGFSNVFADTGSLESQGDAVARRITGR